MKKFFFLFFLFFPIIISAQSDSLPTIDLPPFYLGTEYDEPYVLTVKDKREPFLAGFLSYIIPGGGQLYNKDYEKAFSIWTVMACSMVLSYQAEKTGNSNVGETFLGIGLSGAWLYSLIDAIGTANKINKAINLQLSRTASVSLKPDLQLTRNPGVFGLSKPEAVVGFRLKVSL